MCLLRAWLSIVSPPICGRISEGECLFVCSRAALVLIIYLVFANLLD